MESRFSYTLVGIFVLLLGAALVGVAFWLYAGGEYERHYSRYAAYFDESVAGLTQNAPVRYRGVSVGRVAEIGLAPDRSGRVRLLLDLEQTTPVKEDTVAMLRMQGLTGLAQVELSGGSPDSPSLRARPPEKFPVIQTRPSLMTRLDTAVTSVLSNLNQTAENINALTDAEVRASLKRTLANVEATTRVLAQQMPVLEATLKNTAATSAELGGLAQRLGQTAGAVENMANDIAKTSGATRGVLEDARSGFNQFGSQTLPELNALVAEMRDLSASLKRVSNELERNPSSLVFGRPPAKPGPGE
jgi:phospholipid/cholesterol/gamma-HCH transport system substrate-binding protein